jgi:hypothetical protein
LVPDKVKVPEPALVKLAALAPLEITPVIELAALFVISKVPCNLIAAAVNPAVSMVILPRAVDPPTAPVKVKSPVPVSISKVSPAEPALVVLEKVTSLSDVVKVMFALIVDAPV